MSPEEYAGAAIAYVNVVGWEDGDYGGPDFTPNGPYQHHPAWQRLHDAVAEAVRSAIAEEREACKLAALGARPHPGTNCGCGECVGSDSAAEVICARA